MKRNHHGTQQPEITDITQGMSLLAIRNAKTNSLIKTLIEISKENNREMKRLEKAIKRLR